MKSPTVRQLIYGWLIVAIGLSYGSKLQAQRLNAMAIPNAAQMIRKQHGEGKPTHAVIWLHGLGASSNDFAPVVPYLGLTPKPTIRFIFPQAPDRPITINGGMVMPGWYDIRGSDIADKEDLSGMQESKAILDALVQEQLDDGIDSENIVLAGFSQGGAVAYYTAIRSSHRFAGVLALSTYLPFAADAAAQHSGKNQQTPILSMHGTRDPVVPMTLGRQSADVLEKLGYPVEWKTYPMEHNVIPEQLQDIGTWFNRILVAQ